MLFALGQGRFSESKYVCGQWYQWLEQPGMDLPEEGLQLYGNGASEHELSSMS
jgi:hypothetical protein